MNRLHWYLLRSIDALSLSSMIAWLSFLLMLASISWLAFSQYTSSETRTEPLAPAKIVMHKAKPDPASTLINNAPTVPEVSRAINILYSVAKKHDLDIDDINYQAIQRNNEPLLDYLINFSVKQRYPEIKSFIFDLLTALPYLALENASFERKSINEQQVKVDLRFKLFLGIRHE